MGYNSQFIKNVPLNADYTSEPKQILDSDGYAIQLAFTGSTCSFTAVVEVSNDPFIDPNGDGYTENVPTHFDPLADSTKVFTQEGTFTYNVNPAEYVWVRVVVTDNSSGANSGELSATINVKGPGI